MGSCSSHPVHLLEPVPDSSLSGKEAQDVSVPNKTSLRRRASDYSQKGAACLLLQSDLESETTWAHAPRPWDEAQRLAATRSIRAVWTPGHAHLDDITHAVARLLQVPMSSVTFVQEDTQEMVSSQTCSGMDAGLVSSCPRDVSICAYNLLSQEPSLLVVPNLTEDMRFANHPAVTGGTNLRFYAGCPLLLSTGVRLGSLCIMDVRPRPDIDCGGYNLLCNFAELAVRQLEAAADMAKKQSQLQSRLDNPLQPLPRAHTIKPNSFEESIQRPVGLIDTAESGWPLEYVNLRWTAVTGQTCQSAKGRKLLDVCSLHASSAEGYEGGAGIEGMQSAFKRAAEFRAFADLPVTGEAGVRVLLHFRPALIAPLDSRMERIAMPACIPPVTSATKGRYYFVIIKSVPPVSAALAAPTMRITASSMDGGTFWTPTAPTRRSRQPLQWQGLGKGDRQSWEHRDTAMEGDPPELEGDFEQTLRSKAALLASEPVFQSPSDEWPGAYVPIVLDLQSSSLEQKLDGEAAPGAGADIIAPSLPSAVEPAAAPGHRNLLSFDAGSRQSVGSRQSLELTKLRGLVTMDQLIGTSVRGRIFRGFRKETQQPLTVKVVQVPVHSDWRADLARQAAVARLARSLQHPSIVRTAATCTQPVRRPANAKRHRISERKRHSTELLSDEADADASRDGSVDAAADPAANPGQGPSPDAAADAAAELTAGAASGAGGLVPGAPTLIRTWMVHEWCGQGTLQEACEQGRLGLGLGDAAPSLAPVIKAAADLASAMAHLHGRDIVHGNLCAASVLLAASPVEGHNFAVKLSGLDLISDSELGPHQSADVALPVASLAYLAPELFRGTTKTSQAGDVFAFGVLLWVMYMGRQPWVGLSPAEIEMKVVDGKDRLAFADGAPEPYKAVAYSCMAWDPNSRPDFARVVDHIANIIGAKAVD